MKYQKVIIECESDIFWIYDSGEENLLLYTDKPNLIAQWLNTNMLKEEASSNKSN